MSIEMLKVNSLVLETLTRIRKVETFFPGNMEDLETRLKEINSKRKKEDQLSIEDLLKTDVSKKIDKQTDNDGLPTFTVVGFKSAKLPEEYKSKLSKSQISYNLQEDITIDTPENKKEIQVEDISECKAKETDMRYFEVKQSRKIEKAMAKQLRAKEREEKDKHLTEQVKRAKLAAMKNEPIGT